MWPHRYLLYPIPFTRFRIEPVTTTSSSERMKGPEDPSIILANDEKMLFQYARNQSFQKYC